MSKRKNVTSLAGASPLLPAAPVTNKAAMPPLSPPPTVVRLRSTGLRFVNGVSSSYDTTYPQALEGVVKQEDFERAMARINDTVALYWPCMPCFCFGYAFSICTLGASLLCPHMCIQHAEHYLRREIDNLNGIWPWADRGVRWELRKRCLDSWVEITIRPTPSTPPPPPPPSSWRP